MNEFITAIGGKKFLALLAYILLTAFKDKIGLDAATFENLSYTLMTYLGAQGLADGLSKGSTSHAPGTPGTKK